MLIAIQDLASTPFSSHRSIMFQSGRSPSVSCMACHTASMHGQQHSCRHRHVLSSCVTWIPYKLQAMIPYIVPRCRIIACYCDSTHKQALQAQHTSSLQLLLLTLLLLLLLLLGVAPLPCILCMQRVTINKEPLVALLQPVPSVKCV
jgi:hypothetical protein